MCVLVAEPNYSLKALCCGCAAGKTTLLDVLAQRKSTGTVSGQILVNGQAINAEEYRSACVRPQAVA